MIFRYRKGGVLFHTGAPKISSKRTFINILVFLIIGFDQLPHLILSFGNIKIQHECEA